MHPFTVLNRLLMLALTAAACLWLSSVLGPWIAVAIWAAAISALCAASAYMLHRQASGKITFINRIAGFLLPWGYKIGRGRLPSIVITSAIGWTLLGAAVVVLAPHGLAAFGTAPTSAVAPGEPTGAPYQPSPILMVLLFLSWLVVAAALFGLLGTVLTRSTPVPPSLLGPMIGMGALLAASIALTALGRSAATTWIALALTGGPVLVVGGGYGLFLLVLVTFGRNARWN